MSIESNQIARLRVQLDPFIQTLPTNLLQDFASSVVSGLWSNLLVGGQPVPEVLATLTGLTSSEELVTLATRVLLTDFKNRCLTHAWRVAGLDSVKKLIHCPDADRLREMHRNRQPAVFVFTHIGPRYAIAPAFQQVGVPVAIFQAMHPPSLKRADVEQFAAQLPGMENYWINDPNTNRAIHLKRAVERLQRGELVAIAIDGDHGDVRTEAEFFGHRIQVARGPAVLARLTGVPLIPITVTWGEGWSIDFRVHETIARPENVPSNSGEFDLALTHGAIRFFDAFIRNSPEQLRLNKLARLITLPRVIGAECREPLGSSGVTPQTPE